MLRSLMIFLRILPSMAQHAYQDLLRIHKLPTDSDLRTPTEQRLLYHLLENYERAVRPVRNHSHAVVVKLGMTLTNIFEVDEKNQVITTNVWLDQEWKDDMLSWEPDDFDGIKNVRIPCDLLWLPDLLLYNNADDYTSGYMRSRAMVYFDGTVFWPPPAKLRSTCKIDVTYFPFDSQKCFLKFGSWTYHGLQVDVVNRSDAMDLSNYAKNGEFDLLNVFQKRRVIKYNCCPEPYPDMVFFIHFRRKTLYYMYNLIFPCIMLSGLTLLVFCLPPDSGEKIALGITVLLAFSVFMLSIGEKMPETSESMPLIGIYLTLVMGMTSVSVVMTVMILNFHYRGPFHREIPYWVRKLVLGKLRTLFCIHIPFERNGNYIRNRPSIIYRLSLQTSLQNLQEIKEDEDRAFVSPQTISNLHGSRKNISLTDSLIGNSTGFIPDGVHVSPAKRADSVFDYSPIVGRAGKVVPSPLKSPRKAEGHVLPHPATLSSLPNRILQHGAIRKNSSSSYGPENQQQKLAQDILNTINLLVEREKFEEQSQDVISEWKAIAMILDRVLFWIIFGFSSMITIIILIIVPLLQHSPEVVDWDSELMGLI